LFDEEKLKDAEGSKDANNFLLINDEMENLKYRLSSISSRNSEIFSKPEELDNNYHGVISFQDRGTYSEKEGLQKIEGTLKNDPINRNSDYDLDQHHYNYREKALIKGLFECDKKVDSKKYKPENNFEKQNESESFPTYSSIHHIYEKKSVKNLKIEVTSHQNDDDSVSTDFKNQNSALELVASSENNLKKKKIQKETMNKNNQVYLFFNHVFFFYFDFIFNLLLI
jgi:hypothetical protein